jgi:ssDNA-binding Zn-finger/Zn-ribbon topoisomerase 1
MENTIVDIDDIKEQPAEADNPVEITETPYNLIRSTLEEDDAAKKKPELNNTKVTCPDCGKSVMAKTLQYTHKFNCKKAVTKKDEPTKVVEKEIEQSKEKVTMKSKPKLRTHKYSHIFSKLIYTYGRI